MHVSYLDFAYREVPWSGPYSTQFEATAKLDATMGTEPSG